MNQWSREMGGYFKYLILFYAIHRGAHTLQALLGSHRNWIDTARCEVDSFLPERYSKIQSDP